jgi:hypothetical protein
VGSPIRPTSNSDGGSWRKTPAPATAPAADYDTGAVATAPTGQPQLLHVGASLEASVIGCRVVWVTPEHVVPQILEALPAALAQSLRPPIVHNTSSYDSSDSLRLMEGAVDIYIPDIKLWTRERSPSLPRQARVRLSSVTW